MHGLLHGATWRGLTRDQVRSLRECWTGQKSVSWCPRVSLHFLWSGPLLDPASHEEFFYCGATGIRVSQNPCQDPDCMCTFGGS